MATETRAEVTVIIVSYNTAQLTIKAIETLYANTRETTFDCVVFDNASQDNSVALIRAAFPQVRVIASDQNIRFAAANNHVAGACETPYFLLLNPDTETHPGVCQITAKGGYLGRADRLCRRIAEHRVLLGDAVPSQPVFPGVWHLCAVWAIRICEPRGLWRLATRFDPRG